MKSNNRIKNYYIVFIIIFILISSISVVLGLHIKEKKRVEAMNELNIKLEECYKAINEEYDYSKYKQIVSTIKNDTDKEKAYEKLKEAISNQVEKQKNEYTNDRNYKLYDLFKYIKENENDEKIIKIAQYYEHIDYYNDFVRLGKHNEEEEEYFSAYTCYNNAYRESCTLNDEEKKNNALTKKTQLKDKAINELKDKFNQKIQDKDYSGYYSSEEEFIKSCEDNELNEIYAKYTEDKKNKEWEEEKAKRKSQGVSLGMTKQQVIDSSWGEPNDINTSIGSWGVHEQWVYGNGNYLYFENGILTSIQN